MFTSTVIICLMQASSKVPLPETQHKRKAQSHVGRIHQAGRPSSRFYTYDSVSNCVSIFQTSKCLPATMLPRVQGRRLLNRNWETVTSAPDMMPMGMMNMFATLCCKPKPHLLADPDSPSALHYLAKHVSVSRGRCQASFGHLPGKSLG